jgi:hypothetical protein
MGAISGSHWARLSCESPVVLSIFWHSSRPRASARNRLMRAVQAGNCSRHAHNLAQVEPVLALPGGESVSTRSAQVHKRCTCIHRALVRTLGGATHARIVCVRWPETRPQADTKVVKAGGSW